MIVDNSPQGSPEWMACRAGIPTASGFDQIITTRGEPSKSRLKYMYRLAAERITGVKEEAYQNGAMQRGVELEAEARKMYELMTGNEVLTVGLCYQDKKKLFGCSPDGLIGEDGALELKCPSSAVHISYLLDNKLPTEYFCQVQGQLFVTGRKYVDFMSYYPGIKPLIVRVVPDMKFITALRVELELFVKELAEVVERIK